jgi:hypothetical protein
MVSIAAITCLPTCVFFWSSCKGAYARTFASSASLLALMEGAENINFSLLASVELQLNVDNTVISQGLQWKRRNIGNVGSQGVTLIMESLLKSEEV